MSFSKESAVERARKDLAERLGLSAGDIHERSVRDRDFPNASLGAPAPGEMSAQMISSGWEIDLEAAGKRYEYRADKYQLRLCNLDGANVVISNG